jgi:ABC-type nitrate/sulfonate/bicarbonate transport system substrate-binding protein
MRLGFVPLFDAAPLLVAEALGLFEAVGLRVSLSPEASWAAIRDKLAFAALDGANLLSPMPIALAAGLGGVEARLRVACGVSRNGNGITLSNALAGGDLAARLKARGTPATFAVVFPFSAHNYLLRRWLMAQGLDPERDVRLTAVPPPRMAARLAAGEIDGFCAGAPWGAAAEALGAGRVVAGTAAIWPDHLEKLLAFSEDYLVTHREQAVAATAAVIGAARWLDAPENRAEAVSIMGGRALWGLSPATIESAFDATHRIRFRAATLPRRAEAALWLGAMREAGHMPDSVPDAQALDPFDDAIWRDAAARLNEPEPHLETLA